MTTVEHELRDGLIVSFYADIELIDESFSYDYGMIVGATHTVWSPELSSDIEWDTTEYTNEQNDEIFSWINKIDNEILVTQLLLDKYESLNF